MVYRWSKLLSVLLLLAILQCAHMHVQMHHEWREENEEGKKNYWNNFKAQLECMWCVIDDKLNVR